MVDTEKIERLLSTTRDTFERTWGCKVTDEQLLASLDRLIERQCRLQLDDKLGSLRSPRELLALKELVKNPPKPAPSVIKLEEKQDAKTQSTVTKEDSGDKKAARGARKKRATSRKAGSRPAPTRSKPTDD